MNRWEAAARQCAQMAQDVLGQNTIHDVLQQVLSWSLLVVPGAEQAGITVARRGGLLETVAATGPLPKDSDQLQQDLGEGPCLDALRQHVCYVPDLAIEQRWPQYAIKAAEAGIHSVLTFRLNGDQRTLGALNLLSSTFGAFDDIDCHIGMIVACHAAVAYRSTLTQNQLRTAIDTRQKIGEAVGVLVERFKITPAEAFARLSRSSQEANTKLAVLAEQVVLTGQFDDRSRSR